jgi:hypothetical protein
MGPHLLVPPIYNQYADYDHEANLFRGVPLERFLVNEPRNLLIEGNNVLSVQAHNVSGSSSDFTILPVLSAFYTITPPEGSILHTNFKISSSGETIYLFNPNKVMIDSLVSPEIIGEITAGRVNGDSKTYLFNEPTPGYVNSANAYEEKVTSSLIFSHDGGVVQPLSLNIAGNTLDEELRYTIDGTTPTSSSNLYSAPLNISSTTIVKAKIFKAGYLPSITETRTYIIGSSHQLPVVSLTFDHDDFFHPETGMYVLGEGYDGGIPYFGSNIWEDWERRVSFSFYDEDGILRLSQDMGAKIFGGWSRSKPQRSLSLFARAGYGNGSLDYPLFEELDYSTYQAIVLRNSGNDWLRTHFHDAFITSLMKGSGLEFQAFKSVATYLNGEYWGMYNIREKINEHFLASKSGVDPSDINLLEFDGQTVHGSNEEYLNLIQFMEANYLGLQENYDYVKSKIDIDNIASYMAVQIYVANKDWPGNNIKFWNHKDGKWRWILYDTEFGFGIYDENDHYHNTLDFALEPNGPGWPNPPWSTLIMRKLVESEEFRITLINRFADYLNSRFKPHYVEAHIDSISKIIQPEIAAHMMRWGGDYNWWVHNINERKKFARERPQILRSHIVDRFGLSRIYNVQIENLKPAFGVVKLNSLVINDPYWLGQYFTDVPVTIRAVPMEGYKFSHWSGSVDSFSTELTLLLNDNITLKAHFVSVSSDPEPLVINEINYNSDKDLPAGDWVEIYNPNPYSMNLSNWVFKDSNDEHVFSLPELQDIQAFGYLVLCRDNAAFSSVYPGIDNVIGNFDFGLSSDGELIRLYNSDGELQDEVEYSPVAPWPDAANGGGATLELIDPELENSIGQNWANVNTYGSPGRSNTLPIGMEESHIAEFQVYPNPFTDVLYIDLEGPKGLPIQVQIFDLQGTLHYHDLITESSIINNLSHLSKGFYVIKILCNQQNSSSFRVIKQ